MNICNISAAVFSYEFREEFSSEISLLYINGCIYWKISHRLPVSEFNLELLLSLVEMINGRFKAYSKWRGFHRSHNRCLKSNINGYHQCHTYGKIRSNLSCDNQFKYFCDIFRKHRVYMDLCLCHVKCT